MPTYRVEVQPPAQRDLERLAPRLFERVVDRLRAVAADPRGPGVEKLLAGHGYRVRVGDYRIVFAVDDDARLVRVIRVRHRRDVYRRLR